MSDEFKQILGIKFYVGGMDGLLDRAARGGLIVVPSAPVLANLPFDPAHREALLGSDFAITDTGFMVLLWLILRRENLHRISGVRFLRGLLDRAEFRRPGATFWIMPSADDSRANCDWLRRRGIAVAGDACTVAPIYPAGRLEDFALLAQIEARHPGYVVINVGGGVQERLGYFLRTHLSYRPAILCTGAAIAFFSGRQVGIPVWADRLRLGWLFRSLANPKTFPPRLWKSFRLAPLLWKYGERSPSAD
jgi:N-acetylglucosaminyldiphosphoundecaprenol N-acetyl-beta-D-mannosaminyltransferase